MKILFYFILALLSSSLVPVSVFAGAALLEQEEEIKKVQELQQSRQKYAEQQIQQAQILKKNKQIVEAAEPAAAAVEPAAQAPIPVRREIPSETMRYRDVWKELKISTEIWPEILERAPKEEITRAYISWYQGQGIIIRKSPASYVSLIDEMSRGDKSMLMNPFKDVLRLMAVMEYDFDNGLDSDAYALRVLGQKIYEDNKIRLGL